MTRAKRPTKKSKRIVAEVVDQLESWRRRKTKVSLSVTIPLCRFAIGGKITDRISEGGFFFMNPTSAFLFAIVPSYYDSFTVKKGEVGLTSIKMEKWISGSWEGSISFTELPPGGMEELLRDFPMTSTAVH